MALALFFSFHHKPAPWPWPASQEQMVARPEVKFDLNVEIQKFKLHHDCPTQNLSSSYALFLPGAPQGRRL